ncbi:M56 family metallopeptidase [Fulvivirgaceae bacterium BMA10]|uniref:M56 family metallopeptidase n=1 Tax=Splendidivirga corallicola TaxID=3051826 RepID=A0ABT8KLD3_9BACT|nr:M56 family metallopeptidase [Fulvivirgaceae bacterium BMA10]
MSFAELNLPEPFLKAFGWVLIDSLWQGLIVALLLYVVLIFGKKLNASTRYRLSLLALMITFLWAGYNFNQRYEQYMLQEKQADLVFLNSTAGMNNEMLELLSASQEKEKKSIFDFQSMHQSIEGFMPVLFYCWILGTIILTLRFAGGFVYLRRLRTRYLQPLDEHWQDKLTVLQERLKLTKVVAIYESAMINTPVTLGHLKPIILVPVGMLTGMPADQVETLIIHELIHIKRADYFTNLLQSLIEIVMFYNPTIWWISHCIHIEREHCCDDATVRHCGDPLKYAQALTIIQEKKLSSKPLLTMAATNKGGTLTTRILRILNIQENVKKSLHKRFAIGTILLLSLIWFSFGQATERDKYLINPIENPMNENKPENQTKQDFMVKADQVIIHSKNTTIITPSLELKDWMTSNIKVLVDGESFGSLKALKESERMDQFRGAKTTHIILHWGKDHEARVNMVEILSDEYYLEHHNEYAILRNKSGSAINTVTTNTASITLEDSVDPELSIGSKSETEYDVSAEKITFKGEVSVSKKNVREKTNLSSDSLGRKMIEVIDGKLNELIDSLKKKKKVQSIYIKKEDESIYIKEQGEENAVDQNVKSTNKAVARFYPIKKADSTNQPLFILDGEEIGCEGCKQVSEIDPHEIASISVFKDQKALELYGQKGRHGVVVITSKSSEKKNEKVIKVDSVRKKPKKVYEELVIQSDTIKIKANSPNLAKYSISYEARDSISLKQSNGTNSFEFSPNGKVVIRGTQAEAQPLYFINDIEIDAKNLKKFPVDDNIASINVLKGSVAVEKYGDRAKDGVVLIQTKTLNKKDSTPTQSLELPKTEEWEKAVKELNKINEFTLTGLEIYPNPSTHITNINFQLENPTKVSIEIYDQLGKKVHTVLNSKRLKAGHHQFEWNTTDHPTGVYFVQVSKGKTSTRARVMVQRD